MRNILAGCFDRDLQTMLFYSIMQYGEQRSKTKWIKGNTR